MPFNINYEASKLYLEQLAKDVNLPENFDEYSGEDKKVYQKLLSLMREVNALNNQEASSEHKSLYRQIHETAEKIALKENLDEFQPESLKNFHKQFFKSLYENDNKIQVKIHEELIERGKNDPQGVSTKKHVAGMMRKKGVEAPKFWQIGHPEHGVSKLFSGVLGIKYNPLKDTNTPYVAFTHGDNQHKFSIGRFGVQIQGANKVQPSFKNYLAVKNSEAKVKSEDKDAKKYHHVYFNLLKRNDSNFEAKQEFKRTKALEKMNDEGLGAVVITLPADNEFFFRGFNRKNGTAKSDETYKLGELSDMLLLSIRNDSNDFYIPQDIKNKIIGDQNQHGEDSPYAKLFKKSMRKVLGSDKVDNVTITAEQRQAILFDFVKFQLSDRIIDVLKPDTVNFSCKDAIDRGGIHTLWYEFQKRIDEGKIMNKGEFEQNLESSALLVKGRPMNDHRNVIWNALKETYMGNPQQYKDHPWVKDWIIENYPIDKKTEKILNKPQKEQSKSEVKHIDKFSDNFKKFVDEMNGAENKQKMSTNVEVSSVVKKTDEGKKRTTANHNAHDKNNGTKMQTMFGLHREKATVSLSQPETETKLENKTDNTNKTRRKNN